MKSINVPPESNGLRLDVFLASALGLSRSAAARLLADGRVTQGGRPAHKNHAAVAGEDFEVLLPEPVPATARPEDLPLEVVYEDGDLLVVNKPRGMVVHLGPGHGGGTLVNALLHHCGGTLSGVGGVLRPGIVHRLDKDTSGLMLAAKNDFAHAALSAALKARTITRIYEGLAQGHFRESRFTVDAPIGRHPVHRKRMAVVPNGRAAITQVAVLAEHPGFSHVRCTLETGRTHQIRVHLAHLGHPLLGDTLYGAAPRRGLEGQCLHAKELAFTHPRTGERLAFGSELPGWFAGVMEGNI